MERVGEAVLDGAGSFLPVGGIGEPVGTIGDERPRPDVRYTRCKRIDVAVGAVGQSDLLGEPVLGKAMISAGQMPVEAGDEFGVVLAGYLAIVGDLADIPKQLDVGRSRGDVRDVAIGAQCFEGGDVIGGAGARQAVFTRQFAKRLRANSRAN